MRKKRLPTALIIIFIAAGIAIVSVIVTLSIHFYNKHLHEDFGNVETVYGINAYTNERYDFGIETIENIAIEMDQLDRVGSAQPNAYQTYLVVQMKSGTQYRVKYATEATVLVTRVTYDEKGNAAYDSVSEYNSVGNLPQYCKALEIDHGLGYVYE